MKIITLQAFQVLQLITESVIPVPNENSCLDRQLYFMLFPYLCPQAFLTHSLQGLEEKRLANLLLSASCMQMYIHSVWAASLAKMYLFYHPRY